MRELEPAWPPGAFPSSTTTSRPGGAGADHRHVADRRRIEDGVETDAGRQLLQRRVAQDVLAAADRDGDVLDPHMEAIEQGLDVGIELDVDVVVGVAVAGQEL